MLDTIAGVEVVFWTVPRSDVDVASADRERHEGVAEEFRYAVGSTCAHAVDAPLKDAAAAEHLELEALGLGRCRSDCRRG